MKGLYCNGCLCSACFRNVNQTDLENTEGSDTHICNGCIICNGDSFYEATIECKRFANKK